MLTPQTEKDVSEMIKGASEPMKIKGGGTRPIGRCEATQTLSTAGLSGIELYEPGALTIVAKAGTPMAEINKALTFENQILPFEPMDHQSLLGTKGDATIGGVVAANVSGPRRIQAGACRDSLIGVRFVDGTGTALKNGGRVMKNVTGYDLVKLMAGSYGTLGVITEVAFKLLPRPDTTACLILHDLDPTRAVAAMSKALGSPYEVSGAAHLVNKARTVLRLEGFESSVLYRLGELKTLLAEYGGMSEITQKDQAEAEWNTISSVKGFSAHNGDIWRISVKPSDASAVISSLPDNTEIQLDWGGGLIWAATPKGTDVRAAMAAISGHATLIRGDGALATFHPDPAPLAVISAGLRQQFDPRGLLNPGLMG